MMAITSSILSEAIPFDQPLPQAPDEPRMIDGTGVAPYDLNGGKRNDAHDGQPHKESDDDNIFSECLYVLSPLHRLSSPTRSPGGVRRPAGQILPVMGSFLQ